jgi:L-alanine-DL-glutamate epimerase-like enolase superfamily enzyme
LCACRGKHRGAGEKVGEQEERQLHGVSSVDVAHGQSDRAEPHRLDAARDLGPSSISITLDIYSHLLTDMQEKAAKALEDALR